MADETRDIDKPACATVAFRRISFHRTLRLTRACITWTYQILQYHSKRDLATQLYLQQLSKPIFKSIVVFRILYSQTFSTHENNMSTSSSQITSKV